MTECTVCLHCKVSGWEYQREILSSESSLDETLISLSGEVEHKGFIERMPFDFRLVSTFETSNIEGMSETNVLEINEPIPEYELPKTLSTLILTSAKQLQDLKDCLFLLGNNSDATLSVALSINNIYMDRSDNDRVSPIAGGKMNISSFTWNLSSTGNR
jgi:hypothetical protein